MIRSNTYQNNHMRLAVCQHGESDATLLAPRSEFHGLNRVIAMYFKFAQMRAKFRL